MIALVYSSTDEAGMNIADQIKARHNLYDTKNIASKPPLALYRTDSILLNAEFLDEIGADAIILLSKHSSKSEIPALTVHSTGNWDSEAKLGGKSRSLSVSAPSLMLSVLSSMSKSRLELAKTYEATHHGPLLNTPCFFAELGGTRQTMQDRAAAAVVADSVYTAATEAINLKLHYEKIAIGIGGNHYPQKFTTLAREKGYAFSHIMPKYPLINNDVDNIDMLEQAATRSSERPEIAVIDWKSINAGVRERAIRKLGTLGIDYERI